MKYSALSTFTGVCLSTLLLQRASSLSSRLPSSRLHSTSSPSPSLPSAALLQFPVSSSKSSNFAALSARVRDVMSGPSPPCLLVLPEVWNSPYATSAFADYAEELPSLESRGKPKSESANLLRTLASTYKVHIIGGSVPERCPEGAIYNTCLVYGPEGDLLAKHRKVHLFDIDVPGGIKFKESDTLSPGGQLLTGFSHPTLGYVGVGICYDLRFPELSLLHASRSCNVLAFPGAFNMTTGPAHWSLLLRARAVDCQCYVLACSPARTKAPDVPGPHKHYEAYGHSMAVSPWGDVLGEAGSGEETVVVGIDVGRVKEVRAGVPTGGQKRRDLYRLEAVGEE